MFIKFGDKTKKISLKIKKGSEDLDDELLDSDDSEVSKRVVDALKKYDFSKKLHKKRK